MIRSRLRRTFATSVVLCLLILLLIFEEDAIRAARSALSGVMLHVIPALFPYMVLSSLLAGRIGRRIPPVLTRFFGLPGCGVTAILFGLLCGFPTGAALAVSAFRDGKLTSREASAVIAVSSCASPSFLLGTVSVVWQSPAFGRFLLAMQTVCALVAALLLRPRAVSCPADSRDSKAIPSLLDALPASVSTAAGACLNIAAYVTFFSVAAVLLGRALPPLSPVFRVLFEFSSGALYGAQLGGTVGAAVTGLAVGFSGLSVLSQIAAVAATHSLSLKPLLLTKIAAGIVLAVSSALFCRLHPMHPQAVVTVLSADFSVLPVALITAALLLARFLTNHADSKNLSDTT